MTRIMPGDKLHRLTVKIGDREFEKPTRGSHLTRSQCVVAISDRASGEVIEMLWGKSPHTLKSRASKPYGEAIKCGEFELIEGEVKNMGVING